MASIVSSTSTTNCWRPDQDGGPTILERYKILGVIGQGGMGTVFKGYHVNLKRFVAIKTLRIGSNNSPESLDRFRREMEVVGQLDHPNVVRANDAGEKNGVIYLVMEHLTGLDLAKLIAQQGPLRVADACELTRQAAVGLNYIHQTLVHRDIKPSNLMLTTAGLVKVLDLGLARPGFGQIVEGELTPRGCAVGTFAYIAPEQATANVPVDGRADIYSLGCTLYKLLTNQTLFGGAEYDSPAKQLHAHCHVPLTAVSGFSSIPDELKPLLVRMLAKNPTDRLATGQDVVDALTPFAAGSQNLCQLVEAARGVVQAPLRPLSEPFPEELSCLTVAPGETSQQGTDLSVRIDLPKPTRSRTRVGVFFGIGALVVGLAVLAWSFFPTPQVQGDGKQTQANDKSGLKAMDSTPANTYQKLLDRPPIPVGSEDAVSGSWRWDKEKQTATVDGPDFLLLQLGTTSRGRFLFQSAIAQTPWAGKVGIFWGYRENTEPKDNRKGDEEFASFQFIVIEKAKTAGEDLFSLRRGKATLKYDGRGQMRLNPQFRARQEVSARFGGERILVITTDHNRLVSAALNADQLSGLSSEAANKACAFEPCQGAFGVFTMGYNATFREAQFMAK